jgi:hypothetical protein
MTFPIIEITTCPSKGPPVPRESDGSNTFVLNVRWGAEHLSAEQIRRAVAAASTEIMASGVPPLVARDAYRLWETLNRIDRSMAPALKPLVEAWIAAANAAEEILEEGLEDDILVCGELTIY